MKDVQIKGSDMLDDYKIEAVLVGKKAFELYSNYDEVAFYIKSEFDMLFQPTWHCVVGKSFGSYVGHETRGFIFFYIKDKAVMLFKT